MAKNFLSHLVKPDNLGSYIKGAKGRYFPLMPKLWKDSFWSNTQDPHISVASQQFTEYQTRLPNNSINPASSQIDSENIWGKAMEKVLTKGLSPTAATDQAINRIKEIFAQSKTQIER